ncbi:MAG: hypothetical protein ABIK10_01905 [candidate division WOR-3 bacterium]
MTNERERILAAIGYIPFLFFIPLYVCRENEECQFHGKQSLVLLLIYIVVSLTLWLVGIIFKFIFGSVPLLGFIFKSLGWLLYNFLGSIIGIIYVILILMCAIFAFSGSTWEIPIVSKYARALKI